MERRATWGWGSQAWCRSWWLPQAARACANRRHVDNLEAESRVNLTSAVGFKGRGVKQESNVEKESLDWKRVAIAD